MFRHIPYKMSFFLQKPNNRFNRARNYNCIKEILPNSQIFTKKIARYSAKSLSFPEILDARWHEPIKRIQWRFNEGPLKKFIITRHKNRLNNKPQYYYLNDIISLVVEGHIGITQHILTHFYTPVIGSEILFNDEENLSPRLGLTTNCREKSELERIQNFIQAVERLNPLDKESHLILEALLDIQNTKGILPDHIQPIPSAYQSKNLIQNMMFYVEDENKKQGAYHHIPFIAEHRIFDPGIHATVADKIPAIHQAIFAGDDETLKYLLFKEPYLVKQLDPWGVSAYDLARRIGPFTIYDICHQALQQIESKNWFESLYKPVQKLFRTMWQTTGYNKLIYLTNNPESPELFLEEARDKRIAQMKHAKLLERTPLHLACMEGDFEELKTIIMSEPERINETDCFGFTPLMLCLAYDYRDMAVWLIEQGAELNSVEFKEADGGITYLRLIDQAKTPAMMELLLHYRVDMYEFNDRLITAVKENDLKMAKYMLYYTHKLPEHQGLSALEWAIKLSPKYGTEMLEIFLQFYQQGLEKGPYDRDVINFILKMDPSINLSQLEKYGFVDLPEKVLGILERYNNKTKLKLQQKHSRPKFQSCQIKNDDTIEMQFANDSLQLISTFKRVNDLSQNEIKSINDLFFKTFKLIKNDSYENRIAYLKYALAPNENNQSFVNLVSHHGKIVSFLTFELERGSYPLDPNTKELIDFNLYHGKLTANDPDYSSLGLTDIAFSSMIAFQKIKADKPMFCFIKAIPPGLGFCVLPRYLKFFPKFYAGQGFVNYIGELVKDPISGNKIPVKLTLNTERKINHKNFEMDYFEHIMGDDIKDAMAVIIPVDNETVLEYKEALAYNGIYDKQLQSIVDCWELIFSSIPAKTPLISK